MHINATFYCSLQAIIYGRLWLCRKTFCTAAVIVWLYVAYRFQDLNRINNTLLCEIKKQNSELKHLLQNCKLLLLGNHIDENLSWSSGLNYMFAMNDGSLSVHVLCIGDKIGMENFFF